jgi:lipopolysaccharide biosynthesis glycosyltransferase/predicted Zn-dependent protease
MTVTAFFRDARVKGALAGAGQPQGQAQASSVVQEFFGSYGFDDCSPQQLLALADLAVRCGDHAVAREALSRAVASGRNLHLAYYKLGRLELAQNDFAAAARHFRDGTQADPEFAYNWMGEARALHAMGLKGEALASADRFAAFGVKPHAGNELTVLADLADYRYESGDRAGSLVLYDLVTKFGAERPRDAVRQAEALIARGDHEGAQRVLLEQQQRGQLDPWGRRALALAASHLGDHARAIELAEGVLLHAPDNTGFATTYLDVVARSGDVAQMADAVARHPALLQGDATRELTARIKLAGGDIEGAMAGLAGAAIAYQSRLYYLLFETAYRALGAGLPDIAMDLGARLAAAAPDDSFVKLLRVDIYFRQQMWEQAGVALAAMTEAENQRPHVILKRFEYACFTRDTEAALALCTRLEAMELPNKQFQLPLFRFFAEQACWDKLLDRAISWLDTQFNYGQIGYVLFRAAKHTGRHADLVAAVEALPGWQNRPDLARLRANLLYDRASTLPEMDLLARDPTITGDPILMRRLAAQRVVLARAAAHSQRRAVFLCTDRNYLCATIVALYTATRALESRGVDFYVVADDDVADLCRRAIAPFVQASIAVTVVSASDVVGAAEKLYPAYGLFTSGHVLASAAYYRIYFAKYLQRLGRHHKAVYIDSDVLVRFSLDPLFFGDLGGKPMAARLETMRPEVRRAITHHNLADDRYFNSGVLLFDLQNDDLAAGLDGAVQAITDDGTMLLFHDQCALNLGFRENFTDLAMGWNFPVNETTPLAAVPQEAVVLHFLDRPKPWSAAYGGDFGPLWFDAWQATAAFIGEALAMELFAQIQD